MVYFMAYFGLYYDILWLILVQNRSGTTFSNNVVKRVLQVLTHIGIYLWLKVSIARLSAVGWMKVLQVLTQIEIYLWLKVSIARLSACGWMKVLQDLA